jgi:glycosyltransferase involved in cell wall biosynthesis
MHLLLKTDHDVYFTSRNFVPSFGLYLNKVMRGRPYVFNLTGAKWEMFGDLARNRASSKLFERALYPLLLRRVLAGASSIVCNSRYLESAVGLRYPRHRDRLTTIYNGIEFDRYSSGRRRAIPGVSDGDFALLCVTALNFENKSQGLSLVLEAFGQVRLSRGETKLVVAAKTSNLFWRRWAEECVAEKPWRDSVILLFNETNIPDLLASADLFLYATPENSNDSLPRALLEAQSAGLPAVVTRTAGCPEIVQDGLTGFVVPYDPGSMAERVLDLMDHPELRREMAAQARSRIPRVFNWDCMGDHYAQLFHDVTARESAGSLRRRSGATRKELTR